MTSSLKSIGKVDNFLRKQKEPVMVWDIVKATKMKFETVRNVLKYLEENNKIKYIKSGARNLVERINDD